jgi:heat shock protein HslJ
MWKLERFGPAAHMLGSEAEVVAALAALPADRPVTLDLTAEGRVAGASGCNRFSGEFRVEPGNEVVMDPVAGTRMACDEATMILESTFLRTLGSVTLASVRHDRLELHCEAGVVVAFTLWEGAESIP